MLNYMIRNVYRQTLKPINKAMTIIPDSYYSKDFFDIEFQKIFKKSWVAIGYTNQLDKYNVS